MQVIYDVELLITVTGAATLLEVKVAEQQNPLQFTVGYKCTWAVEYTVGLLYKRTYFGIAIYSAYTSQYAVLINATWIRKQNTYHNIIYEEALRCLVRPT